MKVFFFMLITTCLSSSLRSSCAFVVSAANNNNKRTKMNLINNIFNMVQPQMVDPKDALPGRNREMPNIDKHYVLKGNDMKKVPSGHKVAVYGSGCFWGSEKGQWRFPKGIYSTAVGYFGGYTPNPTYEEACSGQTGHTEGVRVVYDPEQVSFTDILRNFWESHDPTSGMGQGNDRGTQYRSAFYYYDDDQKALIEASKLAFEKQLGRPITTEIGSASEHEQKYGALWYYAENYHQQYLAKPGARPYCSAQPQGISLADYDSWCPFEDSEKREFHRPKLPESYWTNHGPKKGCSVVNSPNEPVSEKEL